MFDAVIIGAGASGLVCAIQAARRGLSVCLLERNAHPGKKILQTGNGRCNLSNVDMQPWHFHGENRGFIEPALASWGIANLQEFSESLGMPLTALSDGRVFPHSLQAKTVVRALTNAAEREGVVLVTDCYCKHVTKEADGFTAIAFDNRPFRGRSLVLATGGMAMKKSGSDGNGYALAERFGHSVTEPFPGIVALELQGRAFREMTGVKFPSKVTLYIDDTPVRSDTGDILFTDYGISGPPVLQLSRHANDALRRGKTPEVSVQLLMDDWANEERVEDFLMMSKLPIGDVLPLVLHDKLVRPLLKSAGIANDLPFAALPAPKQKRLVHKLLDWRFAVYGSKSMEAAQVTCGGVDTTEIDNETMESKKVPKLYIIGELTDVDGDCGGYNLHWAFASATLCARAL